MCTGLHILAVSGDCTLGRSDIVQTTPNPNPGLYIDISNPALCSGYIRRWNICYYSPRVVNFLSNLQIGLQVWRFDQARQNGVLIANYPVTITVPEPPPEFRCVRVEVNQEQFINVTAGDFLGVVLFQNAVLPVVNNYQQPGPAPTIIFTPNTLFAITEIRRQGTPGVVDIINNGIHVTADIGERLGARD